MHNKHNSIQIIIKCNLALHKFYFITNLFFFINKQLYKYVKFTNKTD